MNLPETEAELKALNDYLKEVVKNCHFCAHCDFNHYGICFFAFDCIQNNFYNFRNNED